MAVAAGDGLGLQHGADDTLLHRLGRGTEDGPERFVVEIDAAVKDLPRLDVVLVSQLIVRLF